MVKGTVGSEAVQVIKIMANMRQRSWGATMGQKCPSHRTWMNSRTDHTNPWRATMLLFPILSMRKLSHRRGKELALVTQMCCRKAAEPAVQPRTDGAMHVLLSPLAGQTAENSWNPRADILVVQLCTTQS